MYSPMLSIYRSIVILLIGWQSLGALGTQFLAIPVYADQLAAGGQTAWTGDGVTNPAAIDFSGSALHLRVGGGQWLGDTRISALQLGFGGDQSVALGVRYLSLDDLELRDERPLDDPLAEYNAHGLAADLVWARSLGLLRVGAGVHYLNLGVYTAQSEGLAVDLGARYSLTKNIYLGASLLNLGRLDSFEDQRPDLPRRLLIGAAVDLNHSPVNTSLGMTVEYSSQVDGMILHLGSASQWSRLRISLGTELSPEVIRASGGVAVSFGRYEFQYSAQFGSQQVGLPQILSCSIRIP